MNSYNDIVSKSSSAIETVVFVFGLLIVIAAVVSIIVISLLSIRSKKTFNKNLDTMVENIKKEEEKEKEKHICDYCGQALGEKDTYCPSCGAKVIKN